MMATELPEDIALASYGVVRAYVHAYNKATHDGESDPEALGREAIRSLLGADSTIEKDLTRSDVHVPATFNQVRRKKKVKTFSEFHKGG